MADTVSRVILQDGRKRAVVRAQLDSDGTGSTDAILVDRSALSGGPDGSEPGRLVIERIEYDCEGMTVALEFDHDTDDHIASLSSAGVFDFSQDGKYQGYIDPNTSGGTGDIVGTTTGHTAGDKATFVFYLRKKD